LLARSLGALALGPAVRNGSPARFRSRRFLAYWSVGSLFRPLGALALDPENYIENDLNPGQTPLFVRFTP